MRHLASGRALVAAIALLCMTLTGACERRSEGPLTVVTIGDPPKLADAYSGPIAASDAVLLANVAQGLVRFDARGEIEPGLAERWIVSDDGMSYIFRLTAAEWPDGRRVTAHQVARALRRQISRGSRNPLKDTLGAVEEVVAMTDRVIEIRLRAPRPNLLQLLAQPEFSLAREGQGSGPFRIADRERPDSPVSLVRTIPGDDGDEASEERIALRAASAEAAIRAFAEGRAQLVLGGTFVDLPIARAARIPNDSLVFDPVSGLFGLAPTRRDGPLSDPEIRRLLSEAIDRNTLIADLKVPGLLARVTVLESGLDGLSDPVAPSWSGIAIGERRPELIARADRLFEAEDRPTLRVAVPDGPGGQMLLARLAADWSLLGIKVEAARSAQAADLRLVDLIAPSTSPAWFLRRFRCESEVLCDPEIDELLDAAREAPVADQRAALLSEAARKIDELQLFIPIAAPIRWSLVSDRIAGFAPNRFGRHSLIGLTERLQPERAD